MNSTEIAVGHFVAYGLAAIAIATVSAAAIGYVTLTVAARVIAAVEPN